VGLHFSWQAPGLSTRFQSHHAFSTHPKSPTHTLQFRLAAVKKKQWDDHRSSYRRIKKRVRPCLAEAARVWDLVTRGSAVGSTAAAAARKILRLCRLPSSPSPAAAPCAADTSRGRRRDGNRLLSNPDAGGGEVDAVGSEGGGGGGGGGGAGSGSTAGICAGAGPSMGGSCMRQMGQEFELWSHCVMHSGW